MINSMIDTISLWNSNKHFFEEKICGWVNDVNKNKSKAENARKRFHEWDSLRVYTSVTRIKNNPRYFSLRFLGQEVAEIRVYENGEVKLAISKEHVDWNSKYFDLSCKKDIIDWDSKAAKVFRDKFKSLAGQKLPTHSLEHQIETEIIKEMKAPPSKSGIPNAQPVYIAECPLQVPLPIKGASGKPEKSDRGGNMDILARRRVNGIVRLSVWELKKPKLSKSEIVKAIKQSIIYSTTLIMMLRSRCGKEWYDLIGFRGGIPKKIEVEAVLTIASNQKKLLNEAIGSLSKSALAPGNDIIMPHVAYYDYQTYKIQTINLL